MSANATTGLAALAIEAGLAEHWTDAHGRAKVVAPDTLRALLRAMDLPADSDTQVQDSRLRLTDSNEHLPTMLVAVAGGSLTLPASCAGLYELRAGQAAPAAALTGHTTTGTTGAPELAVPPMPGYYTLELPGGTTTLAVAPPSAPTLAQLLQDADPRAWGLAAQVYSLRGSNQDPMRATHGFGDFGALRELATAAGTAGADALAISPVHALFADDPAQYSPYSPSSRLFLNTLYADPAVLGVDALRAALARLPPQAAQALQALDAKTLIDWPQAARWRQQLLRELHRGFGQLATLAQQQAFQAFCTEGGQDLRDHALFETLHARQAQFPGAPQSWAEWPDALRDPRSAQAQAAAQTHAQEVDFHRFAQWLAAVGLSQAQAAARQAGMRVGLIADLAIGAHPAGSHAWSHQRDLLRQASVGAPPDIHNPQGQAWSLTALSPRALRDSGYAAFLAMLRAGFAHAGGLRIDHILGLARLWLIPDGAGAADGVYLRYPLRALLRLTALEAWRHQALVIGENLGTVPEGFDDALRDHGLLGMDVLWFMRGERAPAPFIAPAAWPAHAAAMTTTHDLPTLEGWWRSHDIDWRARLGLLDAQGGPADLLAQRDADREHLWQAVRSHAHLAASPAPTQAPSAALLGFVAAAPCPLTLVPLEDATGIVDQPNLPGADARHPNWRQRQPLAAAACLDDPAVRTRLAPLCALRGRKP